MKNIIANAAGFLAASGLISPQILHAQAAPTGISEAAKNIPLIALTYPADISQTADTYIRNIYTRSKWPSGCGGWMVTCADNDSAFDQALVRTAYIIPDVYHALNRSLPGQVILQPATVDVDAAGNLTYKLANPELPVAARVDFMAYVGPKVLGDSPSSSAFTHGVNVLPVFAASVTHGRTQELIALSEGLSSRIGDQPVSVLIQITKTVGAKLEKTAKNISFSTNPWKITDEQWKHVESDPKHEFLVGTIATALLPVTMKIKTIDRERAAKENLPTYRAVFGNELVKSGPVGEALLPSFIAAELDFMKQPTTEYLTNIRTGEFGESVRKTMLAERGFNKKAKTASWLGLLTAGLAGAASGAVGGSSVLMQSQRGLLSGLQQGSNLKQSQQQFSSGMASLAAEQRSVTVNVGSAAMRLSAGSIIQLRNGFRSILLEAVVPSDELKPKRSTGEN